MQPLCGDRRRAAITPIAVVQYFMKGSIQDEESEIAQKKHDRFSLLLPVLEIRRLKRERRVRSDRCYKYEM
jgi:hypothetical protein